jgi:hypothetical protein
MPFPTTEPFIEAAERELGVRLPEEYRQRLLARNGGELSTAGDDWQVFPVLDTSNPKTAARSTGHIVTENQSAKTWDGFPNGAVAIASNGTGDLLVLLAEGSAGRLNPQVNVWNHETRKCTPAALRYD